MAAIALSVAGAAIPGVGPLVAAIGGTIGGIIDSKIGLFGKPEPIRAPDVQLSLATEGTPGTLVLGKRARVPLHLIYATDLIRRRENQRVNKRASVEVETIYANLVACGSFDYLGAYEQIIAENKRIWIGDTSLDIVTVVAASPTPGVTCTVQFLYSVPMSYAHLRFFFDTIVDGSGNPTVGSPRLDSFDVGGRCAILFDGITRTGASTPSDPSDYWEVVESRITDIHGNSRLLIKSPNFFDGVTTTLAGFLSSWASKFTGTHANAGVTVDLKGRLVATDPRAFPQLGVGGITRWIDARSSIMTTYLGSSNSPKPVGVEMIDVLDLCLSGFGNRVPQLEAIVEGLNDSGGIYYGVNAQQLDGALTVLLERWAGLGSGFVDLSEITAEDVDGVAINTPFPPSDVLIKLSAVHDLVWQEGTGGDFRGWARVIFGDARDTVNVDAADLNARLPDQDWSDEDIRRRRIDDSERIKRLTVTFQNYDDALQQGTESEPFDAGDGAQDVSLDLRGVTLTPVNARQVAHRVGIEAWNRIEKAQLVLPWTFYNLQEDDVLEITDRDGNLVSVLVDQIHETDELIEIEGYVLVEPPAAISASEPSAQGGGRLGDTGGDPQAVGVMPILPMVVETRPLADDHASRVGVYVAAAANGVSLAFETVTVFMRRPGDDWIAVAVLSRSAVAGTVPTALASGTTSGFDVTNTLSVELVSGSVETTTEALCLLGKNLAAVGGEVLGFTAATETSAQAWDLSNLSRGRCDTAAAVGTHADNETFLLLDDAVAFVPLAIEDILTTIEFAFVPPGGTVDDAPVVSIDVQGLTAQPLTLTDVTLTDLGPGTSLQVEWTYRSLRNSRFATPSTEPAEPGETVKLQFWNSDIAGITGDPVYEVDVHATPGIFVVPAPYGASVTGGPSVACHAIVRSSLVGLASAVVAAEVTATYDAPTGGSLSDGDYGDIVVSGSGTAMDIDSAVLTAAGRALIDDINAGAQRTTLGLGTVATLDSDIDGGLVANSDLRIATQKAVRTYVDGGLSDEAVARSTADGLRQLLSGKDAANGYAGLDANARIPSNKIQVTATDRLIGRDTAAAGASEEISVGGGLEFTGAGGIQRSALTGDVTASAGSGATTIPNDTVTYAKMQNVSATDKVLGRKTAGSGDPEEIDCTAQGRALIGKTGIESMRQYLGIYRIWEDFNPTDFSGTWSSTITGTGQAYQQGIGFKSWMSESSTQGVLALSCNTGTVSTDASCVHGNSTWAYLSDGSEFIFRIGHSNSTSALHRFGLRDAAPAAGSTDVTNGVYFEFDSAASANWLGCSAAASTRTKTSTGYAATNTTAAWQWFKIKFNSTAGGVTFSHWSGTAWVDDLTVTTNIPASGSTRSVRPFFQTVYNGATFREFYCDAFGCNPGQVSSAGLPPVF